MSGQPLSQHYFVELVEPGWKARCIYWAGYVGILIPLAVALRLLDGVLLAALVGLGCGLSTIIGRLYESRTRQRITFVNDTPNKDANTR